MIPTSSSFETFGLPINQTTAFSNHKGVFKERLKKKQLKILKPFVPLLKQFLESGEEILLALPGCSPVSFLEQLTMGWSIHYLKRCMLVVTNLRILHFPTKSNYSPRHSISQIRFGDVEAIKISTFLGRKFTVKYKNETKETFLYVKDTPKLKAVLNDIRMSEQQPTLYRVRHHLCPKCMAPLKIGEYLCPSCKLEFKNEQKARTLSILVPGGGYFYTGHPIMGIGDAIAEIGLILIVLAEFVNFMTGSESSKLEVVIFFGVLLLLEKLYSVYHAKHYVKEYIPIDKEIQPLRR